MKLAYDSVTEESLSRQVKLAGTTQHSGVIAMIADDLTWPRSDNGLSGVPTLPSFLLSS